MTSGTAVSAAVTAIFDAVDAAGASVGRMHIDMHAGEIDVMAWERPTREEAEALLRELGAQEFAYFPREGDRAPRLRGTVPDGPAVTMVLA